MSTAGRSVARAAGVIAAATLLARIAGFGRTLVFSGSVGTAGVGDVYQTVNLLPNIVYEVAAGGVLAAVVVPLVAGQLALGQDRDADQTASALLSWAVVVLSPLAVVLAVAAPWVSRALLGAQASPSAVNLGARMLVLFAPQVVLYGVGIVLTGVLQARHRFLAAALAPLLSSLMVIATYLTFGLVAGDQRGTDTVSPPAVGVLAGGTTLGVVVLSLPLVVPAVRSGVRLRPTLSFPAGVARRAGSLAGAGVLALVAQQAAVLATVWVTHHRTDAVGTVNVFTYVQAVYLLPYAILAVPVATSAFPALAHAAAWPGAQADAAGDGGKGAPGGHQTLAASVRAIAALTAGAAAVLMAVSTPVGAFFHALDRGALRGGGAALAALPGALAAYAPGLVGFGLTAVLTRALYVRGRPLYAAAAVAAGWLVTAVLPLWAVPAGSSASLTLRTLGVSSSLGMTLSALALALLVRSSWGGQALSGVGRTVGAAVVAVAVALAVGDVVSRALTSASLWGSVGVGVVTAVATSAVYGAVMLVADRTTVSALADPLRARRPGSADGDGGRRSGPSS